jgi:hypothetical protein
MAREMDKVLDTTISPIRSAAPGLNLRRVSKSADAEIVIHLQALRAGEAIRDTG